MESDHIALGSAIVAGIAAMTSAWNVLQARLSARDKLAHDAELATAKAETAKCTENHERLSKDVDECREDRKALWGSIADLAKQVKRPASATP